MSCNGKDKTSTNNQWASSAGDPSKHSCTCSGEKKEKTATDNQWTSTLKK